MPDQTPPSHDWLTGDLTAEDLAALQNVPADMPWYAATDEAFRAAVELGIASLRTGNTVSLEEVEADIRRLLSSRD